MNMMIDGIGLNLLTEIMSNYNLLEIQIENMLLDGNLEILDLSKNHRMEAGCLGFVSSDEKYLVVNHRPEFNYYQDRECVLDSITRLKINKVQILRYIMFREWTKGVSNIREFKFRAWNIQLKEMVTHGDLLRMTSEMSLAPSPNVMILPVTQPHIRLMQYTGLKDKNGNEIYEGDILKRTVHLVMYGTDLDEDFDEYLRVGYRDDYSGFYVGENPLHVYVRASIDVDTRCRCTDVQVAGNIYENPELVR